LKRTLALCCSVWVAIGCFLGTLISYFNMILVKASAGSTVSSMIGSVGSGNDSKQPVNDFLHVSSESSCAVGDLGGLGGWKSCAGGAQLRIQSLLLLGLQVTAACRAAA
jgi:hypothetical protein